MNPFGETIEWVPLRRRPNISAAANANSSTPLAMLSPMTVERRGFRPNGILTEPSAARLNEAAAPAPLKDESEVPEDAGGRAVAGNVGARDQEEFEKAM